MRRTRMRAALLVVVAVALAGIAYEVAHTVAARQPRTTKDLGPDFVADAIQHIQNFRRVKIEKGQTVWEITAADARVQEEGGAILVEEPRVVLYLTDGRRQAHIAGKVGRVALEGRELKQVVLGGGVRVELDDLTFVTDEATYEQATDRITATGAVTITGNTLDLQGEGMEVDVTPRLVRVLRAVRTRITNHAHS